MTSSSSSSSSPLTTPSVAPSSAGNMMQMAYEASPIILMSCFLCSVVHFVVARVLDYVVEHKGFGSLALNIKDKPVKSARNRADFSHRCASICHALYVSQGCFRYLFIHPDPALDADPIYGYSAASEHYFAVACGYFLYETIIHLQGGWDFGFIVHGFACFFCYFFSLRPFLHHVGLFFLQFELSGPFFNLRKLMIFSGRGHGLLFDVISYAFAAVFFVVRLLVGLPVSIMWWRDMFGLLAAGKAHSVAIVVGYMLANIALNLLNIYWFFLILNLALKSGNNPAIDAHNARSTLLKSGRTNSLAPDGVTKLSKSPSTAEFSTNPSPSTSSVSDLHSAKARHRSASSNANPNPDTLT